MSSRSPACLSVLCETSLLHSLYACLLSLRVREASEAQQHLSMLPWMSVCLQGVTGLRPTLGAIGRSYTMALAQTMVSLIMRLCTVTAQVAGLELSAIHQHWIGIVKHDLARISKIESSKHSCEDVCLLSLVPSGTFVHPHLWNQTVLCRKVPMSHLCYAELSFICQSKTAPSVTVLFVLIGSAGQSWTSCALSCRHCCHIWCSSWQGCPWSGRNMRLRLHVSLSFTWSCRLMENIHTAWWDNCVCVFAGTDNQHIFF